MSRFTTPGPRRMLRPELPNRTSVTRANAEVSKHVPASPIFPNIFTSVLDLIRRLRVAWHVQRRVRREHGKRTPVIGGCTPLICQPPKSPRWCPWSPTASFSERQLVHGSELEIVRDVVIGLGAVARGHARRVPHELRPVRIRSLVDGLRSRCTPPYHQAILETPIQRHLERMVVVVCTAIEFPGVAVRPNCWNSGRPSSPEPGICEALISRNANPRTAADPT